MTRCKILKSLPIKFIIVIRMIFPQEKKINDESLYSNPLTGTKRQNVKGWYDHNHCLSYNPGTGEVAKGYKVGWSKGSC